MTPNLKIGIPRALLYFKYGSFWKDYLEQLGCEVVLSPETNQQILDLGCRLSVDESCLSAKIYLGHVAYLADQVDCVFVPRYVSIARGENLCDKFMALNDIVSNTFPDLRLLEYSVDVPAHRYEIFSLLLLGLRLTKNPLRTVQAYIRARNNFQRYHYQLEQQQKELIGQNHPLTVMLVSHPYTTYDALLGKPIIEFLAKLGARIIYSDRLDPKISNRLADSLSPGLYWTYNREMVGAVEHYRNNIQGIIFLMTFPCGPDSLVVNLCQHKVTDIPLIAITLDELQSDAGIHTRLESFIDILKYRQEING